MSIFGKILLIILLSVLVACTNVKHTASPYSGFAVSQKDSILFLVKQGTSINDEKSDRLKRQFADITNNLITSRTGRELLYSQALNIDYLDIHNKQHQEILKKLNFKYIVIGQPVSKSDKQGRGLEILSDNDLQNYPSTGDRWFVYSIKLFDLKGVELLKVSTQKKSQYIPLSNSESYRLYVSKESKLYESTFDKTAQKFRNLLILTPK